MTGREYRQDDRTEGYCPQCGEPLSAMTTGTRGFCEVHGWTWADWRSPPPPIDPRRVEFFATRDACLDALAQIGWRPSDRDPGDETDEREAQP